MSKRSKCLFAVSLLIVSIVYLTTIRPGHNWGDDFSMYIHHAKNIVEGIPYHETGYIYNENYPALSPRYYPPVFPLLLAPVYAHSGLNMTPMKVEIIFIFILFLIVFGLSFQDHTPYFYRGMAILLIGLNPIFWDFKENILSDFPFLFFTYLALYAIQRAYNQKTTTGHNFPNAILIGFLIYLSYGTRTAGGVLIPAFLLYDLIRTKRINPFSIAVVLSFGIFALIQAAAIPEANGYEDQLVFSPVSFLTSLVINIYYLLYFLPNFGTQGFSLIITVILFTLILSAMAFSYIKRVRQGITIYEVFTPIYFLLIVLWNALDQGTRFLLPIYPVLIFYLIEFIEDLSQKTLNRQKWVSVAPAAITTLVFFSHYLRYYQSANFDEINDGIQTPQATEFFEYIHHNTPQNAVFIFFKPRALALYTERSAAACGIWEHPSVLEACFDKIDPDYIATGPDDIPLLEYIYENPDQFDQVFQNDGFSVHRCLASDM